MTKFNRQGGLTKRETARLDRAYVKSLNVLTGMILCVPVGRNPAVVAACQAMQALRVNDPVRYSIYMFGWTDDREVVG